MSKRAHIGIQVVAESPSSNDLDVQQMPNRQGYTVKPKGRRSRRFDVLAIFIEDTGQRLDRLASLAAAGDLTRLAREAHALKGSAASMGASAIADAATELEQRAGHRGGDWIASVAALRAVAERSYASLLGWCERSP